MSVSMKYPECSLIVYEFEGTTKIVCQNNEATCNKQKGFKAVITKECFK